MEQKRISKTLIELGRSGGISLMADIVSSPDHGYGIPPRIQNTGGCVKVEL